MPEPCRSECRRLHGSGTPRIDPWRRIAVAAPAHVGHRDSAIGTVLLTATPTPARPRTRARRTGRGAYVRVPLPEPLFDIRLYWRLSVATPADLQGTIPCSGNALGRIR